MTALRNVTPSPELMRLLADYDARGGALDFKLFQNEAICSEAELHREVAVVTVQAIADDYERHFQDPTTVRFFRENGSDPDDHFRVVMEPRRALGVPITREEFVGPYFDWPSRRLILRGRGENGLNTYFLAGAQENAVTALPEMLLAGSGPYTTQGYADAFADPPYGLRGSAEEVDALFAAINSLLLDGLGDALTVVQWSTDWSNYFDSGKEWWGAFLWTIHNRRTGMTIGIAASTTD